MRFLCLAVGLMCAAATAAMAQATTEAPKPLYRDPVFDGAADASIVYDASTKQWKMFYTNRRASLKFPDPKDVRWVHGTPIGVATSTDGLTWRYGGQAAIPQSCTGETLWAPEVFKDGDTWHMWLTVVPGVFTNWNHPRQIVHLTSSDLKTWDCGETLDLGDKVIDASVIKIGDGYRLWFKDERKGSRLFAADSKDLKTWVRHDTPVVDIASEGPKVFRFKGRYWMVADAWKGLIALSSDDATHWTLQPDRLLEQPGTQPTDTNKGQHPDIVVNTDDKGNERAFIYYFVHQHNEPQAKTDPYWNQRTVIQVAELKYADGKLSVDRNATVDARLYPPK
ncbi:glycoside hydrolase family 43 [Asticcacaulis sp. ZE23SCel15]|uniref:glycoside hydrolase family 43 n=1 Tax=Asticcacaulis sp. ZE23SCel15 TaxID=3059027 RepID=UPI00265FA374|nr:glycoside hydrolase family 43 [Asticcacaulis sp. ZE23SCel15]WKL58369.1 glycoside hydrolase family 43 [Asticcacaulis sp. ZE23SCel15]